jgi:DNA-binding transcriptional MocR family regulator
LSDIGLVTDRRLSGASLARLIGEWRESLRDAGYRQLARAVRLLILDGRVPLGVRLPGERELAASLGVSRTTVTAAYALLRDELYLASRQGSGSVTRLPGTGVDRPLGQSLSPDSDLIDFAVATLPASISVHRAYREALEELPVHLAGPGYFPSGLDRLRRTIAERYSARGCPTRPEQIMVTNGAVHGFALVMRWLAGPGDRIVIDHPTYPHAIDAIQQVGCRPVPVALLGDGWDVEALEAAIRQTGPRLVFLIADFHNPTGLCMDDETRRQVAALGSRLRTTIVVDETLADLWLDCAAPTPLAAFDEAKLVISLGSTSKSFWGGLRVGWIRAEEMVIESLARLRPTIDLGTALLEQLVASTLLASDADLNCRRDRLRRQRELMAGLVARHLPDWRVNEPRGGLSLWAELPEAVGVALAATTEAHGARIAAGPRFGVGGAFARFVRLPFTLAEEEMERGIVRLASAHRAVTTSGRRPSASSRVEQPDAIY